MPPADISKSDNYFPSFLLSAISAINAISAISAISVISVISVICQIRGLESHSLLLSCSWFKPCGSCLVLIYGCLLRSLMSAFGASMRGVSCGVGAAVMKKRGWRRQLRRPQSLVQNDLFTIIIYMRAYARGRTLFYLRILFTTMVPFSSVIFWMMIPRCAALARRPSSVKNSTRTGLLSAMSRMASMSGCWLLFFP